MDKDKVKVYTRFTRSLHQTAVSHDVSYYITLFHHFLLLLFYFTLNYFTMAIQWNLQKRTPPITETFTMRTTVRGPELFPIL